MKTLLFTLEYPPFHGGVANYYSNLVKYWPKPNEIFVLSNSDNRLINGKFPLLKWLPAFFSLRKKIKQEKIDHILVGQILPLGTVALIYSKFYKIKYSVFLHGMDFSWAVKSPRKKWLTGKILKNADKIICVNSYVADLARQTFSGIKHKIIVVNPGINTNAENNAQQIIQLKEKYHLENKMVLLSVGRLVKRKGFDVVVDCLPKTLEKIPNLIYVMIGDGPELKNYQSKNNVLIINNASDQERDLWYNICDIFIMPSRNINGDFEGFGIVYLEANLAGKPVIAGKSGGISDAVIDGLNGLLVDPLSSDQIISTIIKLAQDQSLRQKLGAQGKARAINDFNWPKQTNKIYNFLIL
ncbi:MAG: glycosyltransferase family 4 protein [Patescibacteria group bacterium]|jgi:phosphatidylinositol alpha-1,6-mannosyltransferase